MKNADVSKTVRQIKEKEIAKKRWNILAEALFSKKFKKCAIEDLIEINFNVFKLFAVDLIPEKCNENVMWYRYCIKVHGKTVNVKIRQSLKEFTIEELKGFNNTGNVRVWPSEEVLAYLALKNGNFFNGKTILEVGGGMSCLTGLMLAHTTNCHSVCLTDGNFAAIENVREILKENYPLRCPVFCDILVWNNYREHLATYDVILAADCLFFDDCRTDLIHLMFSLLKYNGIVLITAPKRGETLLKFIYESYKTGFRCSVYHYYDEIIWSRRLKLLEENEDYNEDLHYPLFLILRKRINNSIAEVREKN